MALEAKDITPRKLIKALESGKFPKATGQLRADKLDVYGDVTGVEGYCCLGVACVVAGVEIKEPGAGFLSPFSLGVKKFFKRAALKRYEDDEDDALVPSFAPWLTPDRQKALADKNDASVTFKPVIKMLEQIDIEVKAEKKAARKAARA
jgi:hypothetical protein